MRRYKYKAKNQNGDLITGEVEALSLEHAAKLIREQNLFVISVSSRPEFALTILKSFVGKVSLKDTTTMTRQLATMINSGLPITEALLILRQQSQGGMQKVISQILADVEDGSSLSAAMSKHPSAFSKTYIALVKSGEVGGVMDEVMVRLADDMENQQEFRGKISSALIYPIIIVAGLLVAALVMVIFVIPRLTTVYEQFDVELPIMTRIIISFSKLMEKIWPIVMLLVAGVFVGLKVYADTPKGKQKVDEITFKIPLVGDLNRQIILTDLTRTLSLMIGAGVSILEALTISAQVVRNIKISTALQEITKLVEKGFPLAFAFSRYPEEFPIIMSQMIAVGEETGKMDEILAKLSHIFEIESSQKLKTLTAAIEPAILIVLGVSVGIMAVSIILPIYNITNKFSG